MSSGNAGACYTAAAHQHISILYCVICNISAARRRYSCAVVEKRTRMAVAAYFRRYLLLAGRRLTGRRRTAGAGSACLVA